MAGRKREYDYQEVYNYIVDYKRQHDGNSPTLRNICEAVGISSTSVVRYILNFLQGAGKIIVDSGDGHSARHIVVVGGKWGLASEASDE